MSVASFIASQRAEHWCPHAISCRALGVCESWFYKWADRPPTRRQLRRAALDKAVREAFEASGATYGSPRVHARSGSRGLGCLGEDRGRLYAAAGAGRAGPSAVTAA